MRIPFCGLKIVIKDMDRAVRAQREKSKAENEHNGAAKTWRWYPRNMLGQSRAFILVKGLAR